MPDFPVLHHVLEIVQTHVHPVNDAIQPPHPLSSPSPAFNLSQHRVFSSESALWFRLRKYWSFCISPSNEYSGLISFRIDWFDLAVQGTLKSLLQHHSSKASKPWLIIVSHIHFTRLHSSSSLLIFATKDLQAQCCFSGGWNQMCLFMSELIKTG